jgi:sugar phosphate isomerase/epimerase
VNRILSLAAGVLPECPPERIVQAAIDTGYPAAGIWVDADTWTDTTTRVISAMLDNSGIIALDAEVIWIQAGTTPNDAARKVIDVAGELGARNVLIVSANDSLDETKTQFGALCELAHGVGARAVLEFLMIGKVKTLDQALEVVTDVAHPAGGILIDALHLARCGKLPADVARIDPSLLPYAQLCDGPASARDTSFEGYLEDALDARSAPGEGELPLDALVCALPPDTPMSLEVRSKHYRETYPDPVERARALLDATQRFFATLQET